VFACLSALICILLSASLPVCYLSVCLTITVRLHTLMFDVIPAMYGPAFKFQLKFKFIAGPCQCSGDSVTPLNFNFKLRLKPSEL